jgi:hypothetical protein
MHTKFLLGNLTEINHLTDLGVDDRIIHYGCERRYGVAAGTGMK